MTQSRSLRKLTLSRAVLTVAFVVVGLACQEVGAAIATTCSGPAGSSSKRGQSSISCTGAITDL